MGTLYLVATPIGNLEDITARALRVLQEVALIAAEDTRAARNLLRHFNIATPVTSYFEHNKLTKLDHILDALDDGDVAVISEAGLPGISDPGYELVRAALARDVRVVPIPGASALTTALVASGLPTDQFVYLGFLPRQDKARRALFESVVNETRTLVAYEAPHRVCDALDDVEQVFGGNRALCVARELTKLHEEFFRGTVNQAREHFAAHAPRGEFTFVIAGASDSQGFENPESLPWDDTRVIDAVRGLIATGMPRTEAVKRVARESRRNRHEVYRLTLTKGE